MLLGYVLLQDCHAFAQPDTASLNFCRTCEPPKSSTRGSLQSQGDCLGCVTHDLPTRLPLLGPSQGIAFLRTWLQLMYFLPHFV